MARRNSSLGFLGMFGRSSDLRLLDRALRAADLHPALVPEGVKLTIVNLMKDAWGEAEPPESGYPQVAELFAYCALGPEAFANANGDERLAAAARRVEAAVEAQKGLDADLVLLTLHAKMAHPEVVERHDLSVG